MKSLFGLILFGLMALAMGLVWAAEEDQFEEQAERQQLEAHKAAQEAEAVADHARRIDQERNEKLRTISAEDRERQRAAIRERLSNLEKMREALGKKLGEEHPQIDAITRELDVLRNELQELTGPPRGEPPFESIPAMARRIEHLRAAAEHLGQAGMPEMARDLRQRAEDLERELHHPGPLGRETQEALHQLQEQVQDMQQAIKNLHEEVAELRERLERAKE